MIAGVQILISTHCFPFISVTRESFQMYRIGSSQNNGRCSQNYDKGIADFKGLKNAVLRV